MLKHLLLTALLGLGLASPGLGQTIVDPGFEVPALGQGKHQYRPTGSAWSFTGSSALAGNGSAFTSANPPSPQGVQVAVLQRDACTISQTIQGWPAGSYQISFHAAQRSYPAPNASQVIDVRVGGRIISSIQPIGKTYQQYYTAAFDIPAAADYALEFVGTNNTADHTAFVDAVSIIRAGSIAAKVQASVHVASSGKMLGFTFAEMASGKPIIPSQILTSPTISINGQPLGQLGTRWFTGYHPVVLMATPGNYQIRPGDRVTVSAPIAWAFSTSGFVQALDQVAAENRAGKPMAATENLARTLRVGVNNNQSPTNYGLGFYFPFQNLAKRVGYPPSNRGKISYPQWSLSLSHNAMPNGVDGSTYPGVAGLWCVMWDASKPATPIQFSISSSTPAKCTVTERLDLARAPPDGVGMTRVFDVQPAPGLTTADFDVSLSCTDPAWTLGAANYDQLWACQPGDWDIVDGQVKLDRSDPLALSRIYRDRIGPNVGSMRWVDSTICGGNPVSFPYPEFLPRATDESWGENSFYWEIRGYTAVGPIDTSVTPWIYSPFFRQPSQQFPATLGADITTTPAAGTREVWTITDGATAPLMAGLEITAGEEVCRILGGAGTSWTVTRGSNGTTPATHAAGPVQVSGRRKITDVVLADGTMPKAHNWQLTTREPHARTTGNILACSGSGWPTITYTDGTSGSLGGFTRHVYVTGPNTAFMAIGAATSGVPDRVYPLDPNTQKWDFRAGGGIPIEAVALATGKFAHADLHVNVPFDACDDLVYEIARRVLANFPAGRRVYVEYTNEPWNWMFTGFYYHSAIMPLATPDFSYQLAHYAFRAGQIHAIFRKVFAAADRAGEIHGLVNCQMSSGSSQITPHLEYGLAHGNPFTEIAIAPYWDFESTAYNKAVCEQLDDEQTIDVIMADVRTSPRQIGASAADANAAIAAYASKHPDAPPVRLYGYEGGVDTAYPWDARRNHDLNYNPNWYFCELDWLAWCQQSGFDRMNIYNHAMWWNPAGWGGYHTSQQKHSRGDGLNGAADNRRWKATWCATNGINQDLHVDSVRGQAWLDWVGTLQP